MFERGLRRRFDPAVDREAREAAQSPPHDDRPAARPHAAADVHDRPADGQGLRRRDLRRAPGRRRDPDLGPHRRRRRARAAGLARRPRGLPPRHERLRPGPGRADAAGGAVQRRLLAAARASSAWRSRSRWTSRARARGGRPSTARGSAPTMRLDYPQRGPHLRRRRARRGPVGGAAGGGARGGRGAASSSARPRARWRSRPSSRSSPSTARATSRTSCREEQTESHRADRVPDDRRQRGGGDAARGARPAGALPRPRAARPAARASAWSTS